MMFYIPFIEVLESLPLLYKMIVIATSLKPNDLKPLSMS